MLTTIHIWSELGHTPITGRAGSFCDELVKVNVEAKDPTDARQQTYDLLINTEYAERGHYSRPHCPNQNVRTAWLSRRSEM